MKPKLLGKITKLRSAVRKAGLYTPVKGISDAFDRNRSPLPALKKQNGKREYSD